MWYLLNSYPKLKTKQFVIKKTLNLFYKQTIIMKKQLLNPKTLSKFFYSLTFTLLCANAGSAQTILTETFGSQEIPVTFYTGGTSVPAVDYTESPQVAPAGYVSTVFFPSTFDAYLLFKSTGTAARANIVAPLPTSPTGLKPVLTDNTKLVTWTVNMKSSRLSTNQFSTTTGFPEAKYFNATVLCASSDKVIGEAGTGNGTDGYAVIVQKSSADAARVSIGLIKFHNGIGVLATDGSVLTRLIESPVLVNPNPLATPALALSATNPNNLSIKVTYNPNLDIWELYYREDPGTAFVDPSTGAYTKAGASVADAFSTPMTYFGFAAGLQTSNNSGNIYQFDNFKIALSDLTAYTAPPVVEKRQAFNITPTPTVSGLVATGTGTLKWYNVATGGTALLSTDNLVNGTVYYGSLTVGVTESDRVATNVYVGNTALKTLPLYESFDYTIGEKLIVMDNAAAANAALIPAAATGIGLGSWFLSPNSNTTDDVTIVASPTWANTVVPAAANNAISFAGSGIDPELYFTDTTSGNLFSSFLFNIKDAPATIIASTPVVIYSFGASNSSISASVMFKKNITTGKFNLGLSKSNSVTECVWSDTEFDFDTQHLAVINYKNIGAATSTDQVANLWIDPSSTQPAATLSQSAPTTAVSRSLINEIKIQQASSASTPTIIIDEIRVATNWSEVLGGPAPTALPVVENRQAFDSTLEPTVASLVADGTDLKWYTADVGGSPLNTSDFLTTAKYYVSQTINGLESDRVGTNVYVGDTSIKTLPLYESFDYTVGDSLIVMKNGANTAIVENPGIGLGSWTLTPSNNITADVTIVASPSWTNSVLPAAVNNAITFAGSGIDPELKFTNTSSGSLYSSFVFSATDPLDTKTPFASLLVASTTTDPAYSTPTGFYGFLSESTDPITSVVSTSYASDVMFRKNIATGKFNLGLSKSNSSTDCVWSPTEFDFGTQHLIVISYENIGDAVDTNQVANLWIDPATSTQPAVTLTQNNPISAVDGITPVKITRSNIDRIKIVQASSSSTPSLVIDEIRVANNWGEALGTTSTLGLLPKVAVESQCTVYPNPVSNGKIYISSPSNSQKQVAIYSILGQKVLDTKTTNNAEINVSKLAKGNYILKITEDGKSDAKKLIIQ